MAFGKLKVDELVTSTQTVSVDALVGIAADGDKGDITVSGTGTVWTIDAGVVDTSNLGGDITLAGKALQGDVDVAAQRTTLGAEAAGTAASAISTHEAAANPHPGYALESSLATVATTGVLPSRQRRANSINASEKHSILPISSMRSRSHGFCSSGKISCSKAEMSTPYRPTLCGPRMSM